LLPIAFTLMSETIPAAHRGWLLVALGGFGTALGYLVAAGAAAWLEPIFSWRSLWLLGLPTGILIVILNRWIPESPRFLAAAGLESQAREVLARFSAHAEDDATGTRDTYDASAHKAGWRALRESHAAITLGLVVAGMSWGLVNFGFLLWLPVNLGRMGMDPGAASGLLAKSALLALPGVALVILLYHRWSSIRALVLFVALSAATLLAFFAMGVAGVKSTAAMVAATAFLLVSASGVIATLIPYASEIYPVHLRGTGAGIVAASSKFGGILGALFGVMGLLGHFALSALLISMPMLVSAAMLWRSGIETRGRRLEEIEISLLARERG
jgi:putative MFS transporter